MRGIFVLLTSLLFSASGEEHSSESVSSKKASSSSSSSSSSVSSSEAAEALHSTQSESQLKKHLSKGSDLHPALKEYNECQYVGDWGDCDPFKMIRVKEERLVVGGAACQERRNITKPCSREDLPPGTHWLLNEHKLCVQELEKLKGMIDDLHRYIDLIHQRGQALYNAYNELKKRLLEMRREIEVIGRRNHDAEQTVARLRKEVEDWKTKSNKMQMELNQLKAQYKGMEIKVRAAKEKSVELAAQKEELAEEQRRSLEQLEALKIENRNLKTNVLDAERYNEELKDIELVIASLNVKIDAVTKEVEKAKEDLNKCRVELALPSGTQGKPKLNKDTKVNLDMSMWITHNVSLEEGEKYEPEIKYYEAPKYYEKAYYDPTTTTPEPKYETPKYEEPKYEEVKYEEPKYEAPKYEAPKYEEPKYEEPKYEEPKYEEPKYEEPKYEEPKTEAPKYEEPKYEAPKSEEAKY